MEMTVHTRMQKQHTEQNLQQITGCIKHMGIQLGLTKSLRCTLPEGTDGTGYWTMTISALGYKDVTYNFQATDANIVKDVDEEISTTNLEAAIKKAEGLNRIRLHSRELGSNADRTSGSKRGISSNSIHRRQWMKQPVI